MSKELNEYFLLVVYTQENQTLMPEADDIFMVKEEEKQGMLP